MTRGTWLLAAPLLGLALARGFAAAPPPSLVVTVGKSLILDTPHDLRRVSVANGDLADAVAVNPREVLINGKAPGETSVVLWQDDGTRTFYDLAVHPNLAHVEAVRRQLALELPGQDITLDLDQDSVFLRGTVKDLSNAERAMRLAATLGRVVNLLHVDVPPDA